MALPGDCTRVRATVTRQTYCQLPSSFRMATNLNWLRRRFEAITSQDFIANGPLNQFVHLFAFTPETHFLQPSETKIVKNLPPLIDARGGFVTKVSPTPSLKTTINRDVQAYPVRAALMHTVTDCYIHLRLHTRPGMLSTAG